MCRMSLVRFVLALNMVVCLINVASGVTAQASGLSPYGGVDWASLAYPGLDDHGCGFPPTPRVNPVVIGKVDLVRVSGRKSPLALVVAGCNLNHFDPNLYAFAPGTFSDQPALVQLLAFDQGKDQFVRLTTSRNYVAMEIAGFTPGRPLCC